jgi:methionyl-tRNA formyltransferase
MLCAVIVRAVFFGTPKIAVPALRALADTAEVLGVVCQPDRPSGRGLTVSAPEVKRAALDLGLVVYQPEKVRSGELEAWLRERAPDVGVVLAYGRILPDSVLSVPRSGCLNLHASLLPKYRGAAPINWAIANGETETGVSLMQMEAGLDTGPVFTRRAVPIGAEENAGQLAERIAELAATVVIEDVPRAVSGELRATRQDDASATLAPPIQRDDLRIVWTRAALSIANLIRGMAPRPGAFTTLRGKTLKLLAARPLTETPSGPPGRLAVERDRVVVTTGLGALEIVTAQLEGRKAMPARDLIHGRVLRHDDILENP